MNNNDYICIALLYAFGYMVLQAPRRSRPKGNGW